MLAEILHFPEVGSTNDEVMRRAQAGAADGLWVLADRQTQGRGRRGRQWMSEPGNLYCSGLIRLAPSDGSLPQLSFVIALALREALTAWVPETRLGLKWPNDILLDGMKVCGILLESSGSGAGVDRWVVAGVGVNLKHHPEGLERPAISIAAAGLIPPSPRELLEAFIEALAHWRQRWVSDGFSAIRSAWLEQATGLGSRIEVRLPQETLQGSFLDLTPEGALALRLDDGIVRNIHAGDVFGI